jgi:hypothetical protein
MKKLLIGLILIALCGLGVKADAAAPSSIIGLSGECNLAFTGCNAIPLTLTVMCTVSCPRYTAPSFIDSTRFWGSMLGGSPNCVTSTDSGATWAGCTTQPFTSGAKEHYAGASDGSVIAIADTGALCTVKRSTDNGATWPTVFTSAFGAGEGCGGSTNGGYLLICIANGECSFPYINNSPQTCDLLGSTDNGQTWAFLTVGLTGCVMGHSGAAYDGTDGIMSPNAPSGGTSLSLNTVIGLGGYAKSAVWPVAANTCWGNVAYNGLPHGICFGTSNSYELRSAAGVLETTFTLPGVLVLSNSGGLGVSIGPNTLYVIAQKTTPSGAVGFWVTRDNGASFGLLGSTGAIGGMREGTAYFAHGCVFASFGTTPVFTKVCS